MFIFGKVAKATTTKAEVPRRVARMAVPDAPLRVVMTDEPGALPRVVRTAEPDAPLRLVQ